MRLREPLRPSAPLRGGATPRRRRSRGGEFRQPGATATAGSFGPLPAAAFDRGRTVSYTNLGVFTSRGELAAARVGSVARSRVCTSRAPPLRIQRARADGRLTSFRFGHDDADRVSRRDPSTAGSHAAVRRRPAPAAGVARIAVGRADRTDRGRAARRAAAARSPRERDRSAARRTERPRTSANRAAGRGRGTASAATGPARRAPAAPPGSGPATGGATVAPRRAGGRTGRPPAAASPPGATG